ncbi:BppU family phage baseplate upper protein [Enterococcus faecium]|uniref:BppU family phage baseplate upper protein n=1 Tax=Enterococcus faecium TaxID=1352 RepID=UPI003CC5BFD6
MAHIIKKGPIKVPTQPKDFDLQATGLVFKSYDNQIALEFNVAQQDGTPADLLGANLRLLMFIYDEVDGTITKEPIPFITKNLITESFLNGHVVYILPEAMKAYNGMVEAYVYIEYPDGSTSDNLGFTFRMKRSVIDGLAQDKADYFIEDFKQLLAAASLEANKVIEGLDAEIKNLQQATKDANTAVDGAMDRIDGLEAEIGQLERLREMYIDTLDFEGYDYSGNPNLMKNVNSDSWSKLPNDISQPNPYTKIFDDYIITDATDPSADNIGRKTYVPTLVQLQGGKEYTISVTMMVDEAFNSGGDSSYNNSAVHYAMYADGQEVRPVIIRPNTTMVNQYQRVSATFTMPANIKNVDYAYFFVYESKSVTGKWYIKNDIKIEEGPTATPFQPNLLAEPYNMCREYPNENIVNPTVKFPIKTSNNPISGFDISEELIIGETYTVSLKGTKPANKEFHLYYGDANYQQSQSQYQATLLPVEGLANVWSATFTARNTSETTNLLRVALWQKPNSATYGTVQIDWLKIEKGATRTPINVPTYKGLGILDTNDPTKYVWSYTELVDVDGIQGALENVEQRTVTLEGKANTIDGRLNNVNTALNTVQSTADQILAEVTAADVMKETDLPSYLANKPIVAGGMADFAGKVAFKLHPNPHRAAVYALAYEHADQAPSKCFTYETTQTGYNNVNKLDGKLQTVTINTAGKTASLAFKFDLISQITKDFPSFFDDCPTQEMKVVKIRKYINGTVLTFNAKGKGTPLYTSVAKGNTWNKETSYDTGDKITEVKHNFLKGNAEIAEHIQSDGSIIFRTRTKTANTGETLVIEMDYVRFDYTLDLSSDDFITPIERDVTKDNLTQILSDDSVMIKGVMDFKGKVRGNNTNCPHAAYEAANKTQATHMSQIVYEAESVVYNSIQNKNDGLARTLAVNGVANNVAQAKYKFDLVTAIEKEHPHLFKGLTTTKQKVDVLKAKMQELKFNIWCRAEDSTGCIEIGSSLANVDAIDALQAKDVGQTTEFARAEYHSGNNSACARRINDDGTILYFVHGSKSTAEQPQPKIIIDYVNLEYTLSDKISEHAVKQNDTKYLDTLSKTATATSDIAKIKTLIANMLQTETIKLDQNNTDFIRTGTITIQRTMNTVTVYACFQTAKELTKDVEVYTPPANFKPINSMGLVDGSYSGGTDAQMYFDYENGGALTLNTTIPNEKWFTGGGTYTVDVVKLPQGF